MLPLSPASSQVEQALLLFCSLMLYDTSFCVCRYGQGSTSVTHCPAGYGVWSRPVVLPSGLWNCPPNPGLFTGKSRFRVEAGVTNKRQVQTTFANTHQQLDTIMSILTNKTLREGTGLSTSLLTSNSYGYQPENFKCIMKWNYCLDFLGYNSTIFHFRFYGIIIIRI